MTILPIRPARTENHLDQLPHLWNSSSNNPAVKARQQRAEETTQFQIEHDPAYARELAELRSWLTDYEIPQED